MNKSNYPKPVILVTSRATVDILGRETIKDNVMTLTWHMPCSFNPGLYAISIGKQRFSLKLIKESRAFVVNFIPASFKDKAEYCGNYSGEHIDKFDKAKLAKEECDTIDCCRLSEAIAYIECEVVNEIEAGDHIIFIGKVLNSMIKDHNKCLYHLQGDKYTTTL